MPNKLTLIFPEEVEYIDLAYYWHPEGRQRVTKTMVILQGEDYEDGDEVNCYKPLEDDE